MSAAGQIWPNTPEHAAVWWLAAEVVAAICDEEAAPEGIDPRVHFAALYPTLHSHWQSRIAEYARKSPLQ